jgi:hypothetical protein
LSAGTALSGKAVEEPARPLFPLSWFFLACFSFVAQLFVTHVIGRTAEAGTLMPILLPAAHLVLVPFLLKNFSYWGIRLISVGLALNLLVMVLNGGLMPVNAQTVDAIGRHDVKDLTVGEPIPGTKNVLLNAGDIRMPELSDTIILPLPKPFTKAISAGDVLVATGAFLALIEIGFRRSGATHTFAQDPESPFDV